jgi:DNA-binding transcriptional ArsR family regulator
MEHPDDFELLTTMSELLKSIAHPVRLCIVRGLIVQGECNVNKMHECLKLPQSTVSQHLGKLRNSGIIKGRRHGVEIFYQVVNEDIKKIVQALFER